MIKKVSTRHHYIPVFYAKGFTNAEGFFYVYDKQKDTLSSKQRSPKSVFFEDDRNTLAIPGNETSVLEDILFKELDNKTKAAVENLREKPNNESLLNPDNTTDIDVFVLNLFWRIPKTDYAFSGYIKEAEFTFTDTQGNQVKDAEEEERLKNDENYKKYQRALLPFKFLSEYLKTVEKSSRPHKQLYDKVADWFLLGDFPMVFRTTPKTGNDLFEIDYYLPISSRRLFYTAQSDCELKFDFDRAVQLNALIIDQSKRYVCGPDLEYLLTSVSYYRDLKAKGLLARTHLTGSLWR